MLPDAVTLTGLPDRVVLAEALRERGDATYDATGVKLPIPNQVTGISPQLQELAIACVVIALVRDRRLV